MKSDEIFNMHTNIKKNIVGSTVFSTMREKMFKKNLMHHNIQKHTLLWP